MTSPDISVQQSYKVGVSRKVQFSDQCAAVDTSSGDDNTITTQLRRTLDQ